jgi:diadenosine tetraphosphatase ApaH/serine/threonine PP2A family protein phosphatase
MRYSSLEFMQWLFSNINVKTTRYSFWKNIEPQDAAVSGNLKLLKWLVEQGTQLNYSTWISAVELGNLEMIQWLREKHCPWYETDYIAALPHRDSDGKYHYQTVLTCVYAARYGHLHILEWLKTNGHPYDLYIELEAAIHGHIHVLEWATKDADFQDISWKDYSIQLFHNAAASGQLKVLSWLKDKNCPWEKGAYESSCCRRRRTPDAQISVEFTPEVLLWMDENDCQIFMSIKQ